MRDRAFALHRAVSANSAKSACVSRRIRVGELRQDEHMAANWHKRGADPVELKALHSGVPSWLERYLVAWVKAVSYKSDMGVWGNESKPHAEYILEYETAVRRPKSMESTFVAGGAE